MERVPVDECPAGPAMDAAVARALGCKVKEYPPGEPAHYYCGCGEDYPHGDSITVGLRRYSADIAAAWELIDKLKVEYKLLAVLMEWPEGWSVAFSHAPKKYSAIAETAPLGICRAFLKANGIEYVEVPTGD